MKIQLCLKVIILSYFTPLYFSFHNLHSNHIFQKKSFIKSQSKIHSSTQVTFTGKQEISTSPVSFPNEEQKNISSFIRENLYILLSKDVNDVKVIHTPTKEDIDIWLSESYRLGGGEEEEIKVANVNEDDKKMLQISTSMNFPGLRVSSSNVFGAKLVKMEGDDEKTTTTLPEIQMTLINSMQSVDGLPPSVWLYNKLTGASSDSYKKDSRSTSSYSIVKVKPISDDQFVFTSFAQIEVNVKFPSTLIKILPVSVEKLEEQGSNAMQKSIEKELSTNLERFRNAYVKWLEN